MAAYRTEPLPDAPYSVDLLADLHAGVLSESVSERLWPLVRQDESAMAVISALNGVSDRLAEVGRDHAAGEPMPPEVAERIDRSLAAADAARDTPPPLLSLQSRRHPHTVSRLGRGAGLGIAATIVAAIAVTAAVMTSSPDTPDNVVAGEPPPAPAAPTLVLDSDEIDASFAYQVMADRGEVPLLESGLLADCLAANGIGGTSTVLGSAPVELDGRRAVVLVLPRDSATGGLTLLAVAPECDAGNPATLLRRDLD